MPQSQRALDSLASFQTPEHIAFDFRLAGPLLRFVALVIDLVIALLAMFLLTMPLTFVLGDFGIAIWMMVLFIMLWFAGGVCEWLWKGFTPGKRMCGIRVVNTDGLPAALGPCLLRNMFRGIDLMPAGCSLLGLAAMITSGRFQRLGDLVAGTLVVHQERGINRKLPNTRSATILQKAEELPAGVASLLDHQSMRALTAYVERRGRFGPARRDEIARNLADPLAERLGITSWSADELLCAVYVRCYQLENGASSAAAGILAERQSAWERLERLIERRSPRDRRLERQIHIGQAYRAACADLALADAYQLPERQVRYLHDLVGRTHLIFYRRITLSLRALFDQLLVQVPGRLYADPCLRIGFAAFFVPFVGCALLAMWRPELAEATVGADTIANMHDMYAEPPNSRTFNDAGFMTSYYVLNNAGIGLACFVSGIFFGLGSLVYTIFNGLWLGLIFGYMATVDPATRSHFYEFVSAHGPFELSGIALAGAAGLRLGLGLVVREGRPWREAMVRSARRAFPIAMVAALFIIAAAPIEGFVSPSGIGLMEKRLIMGACAALVVLYLVGLGARGHHILRQRQATELSDAT